MVSHDPVPFGEGMSVPDRRGVWWVGLLLMGILVCIVAWGLSILRAPALFPTGERIEIPFGTTLVGAAEILEERKVVRSALMLQLVLIAQFSEGGVQAGVYQFNESLSTPQIARAVTSGTHGIPLVRVTIPEGLRNAQIDDILVERLPSIEDDAFLALAGPYEGYLFPETYHIPETYTARQFLELMAETFTASIESLREEIEASSRTLEEIVTMASILEREADTEESMKLVSGILWSRLDLGMPLQVDASFSYLLGKTSAEVTLDDLTIDSPYNTYRYTGLPPTPLNNPGLQSIEAALWPTASPYLYYLTAPDGTFYYARTFAEHKENIRRYLE